jgi:hypothetical protein
MKVIYESHLTEAKVSKQLLRFADGLDPKGKHLEDKRFRIK